MAAEPTGELPEQSRQQWVAELKAVQAEARRRGVKAKPIDLLNAWLKFRRHAGTG